VFRTPDRLVDTLCLDLHQRMKYSDADIKNRIGLRELLMDPVQRIPRYTMMFRNMIKRMASDDPQRAKLIEADDIASRIALAELDDETKRGQVMYTLSSTVEGFPPALISNSRRFIECIDVEDSYCPAGGSLEDIAGVGIEPLKCSLFLFDDKLMIVKRNGDKPVMALSGLNDLNKVLPKPASRPISLKKSGLQFKGIVEVTDVVATDVGGSGALQNPP
jgi:protein ECT2